MGNRSRALGQLKKKSEHEVRVDISEKLTLYSIVAIILNYILNCTLTVQVFSFISVNKIYEHPTQSIIELILLHII